MACSLYSTCIHTHSVLYTTHAYICRLLMHNTRLYVLEEFLQKIFFPDKKIFASQVFLNSSGSLLTVFG
jgi:hypothetical protein